MFGNLKRLLLIMLCTVLLGHLAVAQSHFMYIQSEKGSPFYVKMNDSLLSSTHSGYLILHNLKGGTFPVVIGLAKKKVPEAAFSITVGESGDEGYMLRSVGGKLQLENIQNHSILKPAEVATSAGNRILPSTIADMQEQHATPTTSGEVASDKSNEKKADDSKKQGISFEKMLSTVTGDSPPASSPAKPKQSEPEVTTKPDTKKTPVIAEANEPSTIPEPVSGAPADTEETKKTPSFFDLIRSDNNKSPDTKKQEVKPVEPPVATTQESPAPAADKQDLNFINFTQEKNKEENKVQQDTDSYSDTLITSGKELKQWKKQQRRMEKEQGKKSDSNSLFDKLLEKIDTASAVTDSSPSVASPLFSDQSNQQEKTVVATNMSCTETADVQYFNKVRRKIAAKKSQEAMLRTANHYFSDGKCFTVPQIEKLAYLFPSDDSRLQFLKAAYLHCTEKDQFKTLVKVLSDKRYQNRLESYLR